MAGNELKECYRERGSRKWYNSQPKDIQKNMKQYNERHEIKKDSKNNYYCKTCKDQGMKEASYWNKPETYWYLEEIQIRELENQSYPVSKVKPLRANQKVTDEALLEKFERLKDKYIQVSDLKIIFGKSVEHPDGFITVNEPKDDSKMTTVISSTYLNRLSKMTGKNWHQKRAYGENNELLVKFTEGPEPYLPKLKQTRLDKLTEQSLRLKIEREVEKLEEALSYAKLGFVGLDWEEPYHNDEQQQADIEELQSRIQDLNKILGISRNFSSDRETIYEGDEGENNVFGN